LLKPPVRWQFVGIEESGRTPVQVDIHQSPQEKFSRTARTICSSINFQRKIMETFDSSGLCKRNYTWLLQGWGQRQESALGLGRRSGPLEIERESLTK
jgi:hypothetical protein